MTKNDSKISMVKVVRERNRAAQAAYRRRQADAGRKQRVKYLTKDEDRAVDAFIEQLRESK